MDKPYCLVLDVWEGQLEMDEAELKRGGVAGLVIRLNDMNGGHHMDTGFAKQWAEAEGFARCPYFVYNPWVSGQANFDWLLLNIPEDAGAVMVDIEVRYSAVSPDAYAAQVREFMAMARLYWNVATYTGEWFLPYLSRWDTGDYWWAQYPLSMYPPTVQSWSWDKLRAEIDKLDRPFNEAKCPGTVRMWQMSGDRIILPGTVRPIDINVFYGDEAALREFFGSEQTTPPDPEFTPEYKRGWNDALESVGAMVEGMRLE